MNDLFSGLAYLIEVIISLINPQPIIMIDLDQAVFFAKASLSIFVSFPIYFGARNVFGNGKVGPLIITLSFTGIAYSSSTKFFSEESIIGLCLYYYLLIRVLDGVLFGIGFYRFMRHERAKFIVILTIVVIIAGLFIFIKPFDERMSYILYKLRELPDYYYTIIFIILTFVGMNILSLSLSNKPGHIHLTPLSLAAIAIAGMLILPSAEDMGLSFPPLVFDLAFPSSTLFGILFGKKAIQLGNQPTGE